MYESPDAASVWCYTPDIITLPGRRLVASCEIAGPGVKECLHPAEQFSAELGERGIAWVG